MESHTNSAFAENYLFETSDIQKRKNLLRIRWLDKRSNSKAVMQGDRQTTLGVRAGLPGATQLLSLGYQLHAPLNDFFSNSKVKFRWTSIKCFHDDNPVLLAAVEFIMETFD